MDSDANERTCGQGTTNTEMGARTAVRLAGFSRGDATNKGRVGGRRGAIRVSRINNAYELLITVTRENWESASTQ